MEKEEDLQCRAADEHETMLIFTEALGGLYDRESSRKRIKKE